MFYLTRLFLFLSISRLFLSTAYSQSTTVPIKYLEKWHQSTVSLGLINDIIDESTNQFTIRKGFSPVGTGVMFYIKNPIDTTKLINFIVTAKHVVFEPLKGWYPESLMVRLAIFDSLSPFEYSGIKVQLRGTNDTVFWIPHPDSTVDLVCIPFFYDSTQVPSPLNVHVIPYSLIGSHENYYEGNSVWVLGYPGFIGSGLWSKSILRRGMISWVSPTDRDRKIIMIDCNVFPGNSGGPVFEEPRLVDINGDILPKVEPKFIGIISRGKLQTDFFDVENDTLIVFNPRLKSTDTLINKNHRSYFQNYTSTAFIEPSTRVKELLNHGAQLYKKLLYNSKIR